MNYKQFDICIILQNNIPITVCYFISTPGNYYDIRYYSYPETQLSFDTYQYVYVNNLSHLNYSDAKLILKQIYDNLPKSHPELFV